MQVEKNIPKDLFPCSSEYKYEKNPYYIVAPDYTHKSSGIRILHELCSILNQFGCEAYVITGKTRGDLWTPRLTDETKAAHYESQKTPIVVYPEVVKGTPLNLGLPVRYVLNYPGLLGGDSRYSNEEIVFSYMQEYYSEGQPLNIPVTDIRLIESVEPKKNREKNSSALYFNRNIPSDSEIMSFGEKCIEISPRKSCSYEEMISILKSVEILYCYENSNIIIEALLSGCAVVFIQNKNLIELPKTLNEIGNAGIAWGRDEAVISSAIASVHEAKKKYN